MDTAIPQTNIIPFTGERFRKVEATHPLSMREVYWHRGGKVYAEIEAGNIEQIDRRTVAHHLIALGDMIRIARNLSEASLLVELGEIAKQLMTARESALIWHEMFDDRRA